MTELLGSSSVMKRLREEVARVASSSAPVLISGETGTGKELVAQAIHELSARSKGPFVPVNCAAIPETLFESEIFGHEKGAFTGASERRAGCFEQAHGGTMFLDEVAEMSPSTQAKFLRILQDGRVRRVGGKTERQVDVRVLAATNKDPLKAVGERALRQDLYYRLNVHQIYISPLRERKEDIPLLLEAFLDELARKNGQPFPPRIDRGALEALQDYDWPGNVRELRSVAERALTFCGGEIHEEDVDHLLYAARRPGYVATGQLLNLPIRVDLKELLEKEKESYVRDALSKTGGNVTRAADMLGYSKQALWKYVKEHHLV